MNHMLDNAGVLWTAVQVQVVLGQSVDVVEHKALPIVESQGLNHNHSPLFCQFSLNLNKSNVQKFSPVEHEFVCLFHNKDGILQLLALQESMDVVEETEQVPLSAPSTQK